MNALRNVMVQAKPGRGSSEPFPHQTFTASIAESIALARLTFPASLWHIEGSSDAIVAVQNSGSDAIVAQPNLF